MNKGRGSKIPLISADVLYGWSPTDGNGFRRPNKSRFRTPQQRTAGVASRSLKVGVEVNGRTAKVPSEIRIKIKDINDEEE